METKKRTIRTPEERIAEIDAKIEKHKKDIASLEAKKKAILNPSPKTTYSSVMKYAKENGISPEDLMAKLSKKK